MIVYGELFCMYSLIESVFEFFAYFIDDTVNLKSV